MKDSGSKRDLGTGSMRDNADDKPRMELLPLDLLERVAFWYGEGALKYTDNNWRKGQPESVVIGCLLRHLSKYQKNMKDEDHAAAIVWNALALMNADTYYKDNDKVCDITGDTPWFTESKPTGNGSYNDK